MPNDQVYIPPPHLSDRAKCLWCSIVPSRARSAERLALLSVALESLDRADSARAEIDKTGMVCITKRSGVPHTNPLLKVEREARALFAKLWGQMNLQFSPDVDSHSRRDDEIRAIIADHK